VVLSLNRYPLGYQCISWISMAPRLTKVAGDPRTIYDIYWQAWMILQGYSEFYGYPCGCPHERSAHGPVDWVRWLHVVDPKDDVEPDWDIRSRKCNLRGTQKMSNCTKKYVEVNHEYIFVRQFYKKFLVSLSV